MAIRQLNDLFKQGFVFVGPVGIDGGWPENGPKNREASVVFENGIEIEIDKAPGVRPTHVNEAETAPVEDDAPVSVELDTVAYRISPERIEWMTPAGDDQTDI
jgi:hypothetical protein